jgi:hypothetical protein
MAKAGLGLLHQWREIEAQDRVRGADAFRGELLGDVREISDKTNRVLALFSPWGLETAIGPSPVEVPTLPERVLAWLSGRPGRARTEDDYPEDDTALPRLSVQLMQDPAALGRAIEEARLHLVQVRESAAVLVPPLGPTSESELKSVLFLEEKLLVHAESVMRLGASGKSPRSAEALVGALMLSSLASTIRNSYDELRVALAEELRDLPGAQPRRRLKSLRRRHQGNERLRRDMMVQLLRQEADAIDEVLDRGA